jgi:hypothetical protein
MKGLSLVDEKCLGALLNSHGLSLLRQAPTLLQYVNQNLRMSVYLYGFQANPQANHRQLVA